MAINESEPTTEVDAINIYFLAAPEDEPQCIAIKKYLTPIVRSSKRPIEIESDFDIPPGQDVKEYKQKLYEAEIVLAFISSDFINDDEIYARTQKVIERYNRDETIMLPILVRNCMWKSTPFVNLTLLPKNYQPLNNKQYWNSEDDALTAVVTDIYEAIKNFTYESRLEMERAEMKVAEALEDAEIENSPPAPEKEKPVKAAARTQVEKPRENKKAQRVNQQAQQQRSKKTANATMQVDWRKKYYRNVLWKRALAYYLDNLITALPAMFLAMILWFMVSVSLYPDSPEEVSDTETTFVLLFSIFFYFIICAIFESSKYRGTFGKMILKLEITDRNGNRITFFKAFWRNIFRMITAYSYMLIIPLIIQIFTFRKTKKLFHDQFSSTVVGEKIKR
ncbi:RDD family protein [Aequorivita sp. F47161]|uniref:RDD family protein n=1 Tax=Aequorivita vitellina TaxID=2874475 RepID=A0A9X1QWS7_9FLAO|nr:RDD family protein [Aequorivita vitellina]MCG2420398.1 RDD family protein [Aequorivita vitellina]